METVEKKFKEMGADVQIRYVGSESRTWRDNQRSSSRSQTPLRINVIGRDEKFDIAINSRFKNNLDLQILQVLPDQRHLVMVARVLDQHGRATDKHHFLCGHDERHWFVAGVNPTSTVNEAKLALKPKEIAEQEAGMNSKKRNRRKTDIYSRQGEWFFVPKEVQIPENLIRKNEPIRRSGPRGGGKAHWAEFAYRTGGDDVMVSGNRVLTIEEYEIEMKKPNLANWEKNWQAMKRNPTLYVTGKITHPDHATITLTGWHQVFMNTERRVDTVAFLD